MLQRDQLARGWLICSSLLVCRNAQRRITILRVHLVLSSFSRPFYCPDKGHQGRVRVPLPLSYLL